MHRQTTQSEQCPIPEELIHAAALWYRGGYTCKAPGGYVREYNPFHPNGSRRGLVMQHRLVMERHLGRLLNGAEVVHHKNGDRTDNHISNLELMKSQTHHMRHEHAERRNARYLQDPGLVQKVLEAAKNPRSTMSQLTDISSKTIRRICEDHGVAWESGSGLTEQQVRKALQGRSTEQAARLLEVHPQTLRNNFDHLLEKRRSPGWYEPYKQEIQQIAKDHSMAEAARQFGTHRAVIRKLIRRWSEQDAKRAAPDTQPPLKHEHTAQDMGQR